MKSRLLVGAVFVFLGIILKSNALTNEELFNFVRPYATNIEVYDIDEDDSDAIEAYDVITLPGGPDDDVDFKYLLASMGLMNKLKDIEEYDSDEDDSDELDANDIITLPYGSDDDVDDEYLLETNDVITHPYGSDDDVDDEYLLETNDVITHPYGSDDDIDDEYLPDLMNEPKEETATGWIELWGRRRRSSRRRNSRRSSRRRSSRRRSSRRRSSRRRSSRRRSSRHRSSRRRSSRRRSSRRRSSRRRSSRRRSSRRHHDRHHDDRHHDDRHHDDKPFHCECQTHSCECCLTHNFRFNLVKKFHISLHACVSAAIVEGTEEVDLTFKINDNELFHKEISLENPPEMCFPIPGLSTESRVCLELYDVNLSTKSLCTKITGDIDIKVHKFNIDLELGCMKIPISDKDAFLLMVNNPDFRQNQPIDDAVMYDVLPRDVVDVIRSLQKMSDDLD